MITRENLKWLWFAFLAIILPIMLIYALMTFGIMGILSFFMWVFNYGC